MKLDALQPSDAQRGQPVVVLQASELALYGGAAVVQAAPSLCFAGAKWRCPAGECQPRSRWVKAERRYAPAVIGGGSAEVTEASRTRRPPLASAARYRDGENPLGSFGGAPPRGQRPNLERAL